MAKKEWPQAWREITLKRKENEKECSLWISDSWLSKLNSVMAWVGVWEGDSLMIKQLSRLRSSSMWIVTVTLLKRTQGLVNRTAQRFVVRIQEGKDFQLSFQQGWLPRPSSICFLTPSLHHALFPVALGNNTSRGGCAHYRCYFGYEITSLHSENIFRVLNK